MENQSFENLFKAYIDFLGKELKSKGQYIFSPEEAKEGVKNARKLISIDYRYITIEEIRNEERQKPNKITLDAFKFFIKNLYEMRTPLTQNSNTEFRKKYEAFSGSSASQMADFKLPIYKDFIKFSMKNNRGREYFREDDFGV